MKRTNKLLSVIMIVALALSLAVPAFAEEPTPETGSITVSNTVAGQTYTVYQIASLESYDGDKFAYKLNDAWKKFVRDDGQDEYTFTVPGENEQSCNVKECLIYDANTGYVTWTNESEFKGDAVYAAFAQCAKDYAEAENLAPAATVKATGNTVTFENLPLGWYLLDSSLGVLCSLDTNTPDVAIMEKNDAPTISKQIADSDQDSWADADVPVDSETFQIGDTVYYRVEITLQPNLKSAVFEDTMADSFTFGQNVKLQMEGEDEVIDLRNPDDYMYALGEENANQFTVFFEEEFLKNIKQATKIYVTYTAILNQNANIYDGSNDNTAKLIYTAEKDPVEITDTTKAYTFKMPVYKYHKVGGENAPLAGAGFTLYKDGVAVKLSGSNGVYKVDPIGSVTEIITGVDGIFTIQGLDEATYVLKETTTPAGYNTAKDTTVVIGENGVLKPNDEGAGVERIEILNSSGTELPSTGGIGTTIFYICGGLMVLAAVVVLVSKRRMSTAE